MVWKREFDQKHFVDQLSLKQDTPLHHTHLSPAIPKTQNNEKYKPKLKITTLNIRKPW